MSKPKSKVLPISMSMDEYRMARAFADQKGTSLAQMFRTLLREAVESQKAKVA